MAAGWYRCPGSCRFGDASCASFFRWCWSGLSFVCRTVCWWFHSGWFPFVRSMIPEFPCQSDRKRFRSDLKRFQSDLFRSAPFRFDRSGWRFEDWPIALKRTSLNRSELKRMLQLLILLLELSKCLSCFLLVERRKSDESSQGRVAIRFTRRFRHLPQIHLRKILRLLPLHSTLNHSNWRAGPTQKPAAHHSPCCACCLKTAPD